MKLLLLLTAVVLVGCSQVSEKSCEAYWFANSETLRFYNCNSVDEKFESIVKREVFLSDNIYADFRETQRDIRAIKNELMGVETGCRLEKKSWKYDGYVVIETICKGDQKTVNAYRAKNCVTPVTICVKDDPESCEIIMLPDYCKDDQKTIDVYDGSDNSIVDYGSGSCMTVVGGSQDGFTALCGEEAREYLLNQN